MNFASTLDGLAQALGASCARRARIFHALTWRWRWANRSGLCLGLWNRLPAGRRGVLVCCHMTLTRAFSPSQRSAVPETSGDGDVMNYRHVWTAVVFRLCAVICRPLCLDTVVALSVLVAIAVAVRLTLVLKATPLSGATRSRRPRALSSHHHHRFLSPHLRACLPQPLPPSDAVGASSPEDLPVPQEGAPQREQPMQDGRWRREELGRERHLWPSHGVEDC